MEAVSGNFFEDVVIKGLRANSLVRINFLADQVRVMYCDGREEIFPKLELDLNQTKIFAAALKDNKSLLDMIAPKLIDGDKAKFIAEALKINKTLVNINF